MLPTLSPGCTYSAIVIGIFLYRFFMQAKMRRSTRAFHPDDIYMTRTPLFFFAPVASARARMLAMCARRPAPVPCHAYLNASPLP